MADIIEFQPRRSTSPALTGDLHSRTEVQKAGEYLASLAIDEIARASDEGLSYRDIYAALDEARRYVGQRQLHDMAVRVLGFGFGPRPTSGGAAA